MAIWIRVEKAAELLGLSRQAVWENALAGAYGPVRYVEGRGGNAGRVLEIDLAGLPPQAQVRYFEETYGIKRRQEAPAVPVLPELGERAREKVYRRLELVEAWREFKYKNSGSDLAARFVEAWNAAHPDRKISRATLYRLDREYRTGGLGGLVDRRGGDRRSEAAGAEEITDFAALLYRYYLDPNQPDLAFAYALAADKAREKGLNVPSYSTAKRLVKKLPYPVLVMHREGEKAFNDKCLPYIERDYTSIKSNEWWTSDHHQFDVFVKDGKKLVRPWVTVFMDMRSRLALGWAVSTQPSQDTVLAAFARAVRRYGVPENVYFDNGKDYRSRLFVEYDEARVRGIMRELGVAPHFAKPYNAQAKPAERLFLTLEKKFGKLWQTYCGSNPDERPERLKKILAGKEPGDVPTLAEFEAVLGDWLENVYNMTPHRGQGMDGQAPFEVYHANLAVKRTAPESVLRIMLMKTTRPVLVRRNGVWFADRWFWNEELAKHQGEKVYLRYDLEEIGRVHVFSLNDEYITTAEQKDLLSMGARAEDMAAAQREKKRARALARRYKARIEELGAEPDGIKRAVERRKEALAQSQQPAAPSPAPRPKVVELVRSPAFEAAARKMAAKAENPAPAPVEPAKEREWAARLAQILSARKAEAEAAAGRDKPAADAERRDRELKEMLMRKWEAERQKNAWEVL